MGNQSITGKSWCCDREISESKDINVDNSISRIKNTEEKGDDMMEEKNLIVQNDFAVETTKQTISNNIVQSKTSQLLLVKQQTNNMIQRTVTGAFNKIEIESSKVAETVVKQASSKVVEVKDISYVNNSNSSEIAAPKSKFSHKNIDSNTNMINSLKNYTFSSEANNLIKGENILKNLMKNKDYVKPNNYYIPKIINNSPDEILLQFEFIVNNYSINNKIFRTKTKNLSPTSKYVLLSRLAIKICKSRDYYISYGTTISEVLLSHITLIELIKNPFSKIMLHTINITYGKDNIQFSLSSEDGKEVEIWYHLISFLIKSV